ncbi:MAG: oligoendopeptidase F [Clostridia bacterium]|nr:oligoendopeptidase F [Clostridia bacterium]
MKAKERVIPERKDVDVNYTWDLTAIFPNDEAWEQAYNELCALPEQIVKYRGRLGESAETLLEFFRRQDATHLAIESVYGYASLKGDEDTANSFYQNMRGKAMGAYVAISGAAAFATPEILAIPNETLAQFYKEKPELLTYKRSIDRIRRRKAHILSADEEKLLAAAGEVADSPDKIGSTLRNAEMVYPDAVDAAGGKHNLTNGSLTLLLESSDRILRENAFTSFYTRLGEFKNTIAATLDAQFKQLRFFAGARKYGSTLEASLDETEVPVEVYLNLIDAVHANMDKMYRYVELRKKMLGVDELHMYDVYTPIVEDADATIPFEQAKATVLEALAVLGTDYTDILKTGFRDRWIDVYENKGKRGGAYSSGMSRPHPYVLLNHKDNLDSQFTLAHEMGHSLHSYLSSKNQPVNCADYVIFVAEVASTVNEVLLMKYLLSKTFEPKERAYLINHFLDQFKGTVYRQTMFAEFELFMGKQSEAGETLTAEALCEKYLELNKLYFGPAMISDDLISLEWARIPHFFYNYYVFQYATGFSAAVAIANRILAEGAPAVNDYKRFLSSGGSADPLSLLKIAGVDMSTSAPVNSALDLFGELVDEMTQLLK